jgi:excinuclease ABC subunit C
MVVFEKGRPKRSDYRKFRIRSVEGPNDYACMEEVLTRRFRHGLESKASVSGDGASQEDGLPADSFGRFPDVLLMDGGRGQVRMAKEIFNELGLPISVIVGVAKGEGRKTGLETLIFADGREPLVLGGESPALMLIAMIRDEAHRFAITGMRAKRSKARQASRLEDIEGIGPKRRQALLTRFGGMKALRNASMEDIATISGISRALAQRIFLQLHGVDTSGE